MKKNGPKKNEYIAIVMTKEKNEFKPSINQRVVKSTSNLEGTKFLIHGISVMSPTKESRNAFKVESE